MADDLTPKQRAFVEAYDGDVKTAAEKAGMSYGHARALLTKSDIAAAIRDRQRERIRPHILSREQRQEWWSKVMQDEQQAMRDRLKASELLGKSEADFTDKVEHSGETGINLIVTLDDYDPEPDE